MKHIELEDKSWGVVSHIFNEPVAVSVLRVEKGGYSSRHYHQTRVNAFFVESGSIQVVEYTRGGSEISRTTLNPGDWTEVPAGVVHRFVVLEPGVVIEIYWPTPIQGSDIVRLDVGGKY